MAITHNIIWLISLLVLSVDPAVLIPADSSSFEITVPEHAKEDTYHLAIIKGAAPSFRVLVKDHECHLQKLTSFSIKNKCIYAVNGGPFSSYIKGGCVGLVISDGKRITNNNDKNAKKHITHFDENNVSDGMLLSFGLTYSNEWIIGRIPVELIPNVKELVTGLDENWLVFNSTSIVPNDNNTHRAPRTAIGVKRSGELVILQVDGCEHCFAWQSNKRGATLSEIANALLSEGAHYAINLDGGGSSSSVQNDHLISVPTCLDYVDVKCERPIASAICVGVHS
jgi:exopolysaccharide biosynthesis protein